jgi:hypothetical protein
MDDIGVDILGYFINIIYFGEDTIGLSLVFGILAKHKLLLTPVNKIIERNKDGVSINLYGIDVNLNLLKEELKVTNSTIISVTITDEDKRVVK